MSKCICDAFTIRQTTPSSHTPRHLPPLAHALDPAGLEELQQQRISLLAAARDEESERAQLAANLATLQRRLGQLDASLEKKAAAKVWRSLRQLATSYIPLFLRPGGSMRHGQCP